MRLIFIRDGDPDYENDSLTEKGRREASFLAKRVASWDMDKVFCSPMGRARETMEACLAERAKAGIKDDPVTFDWLQEFHYRVDRPDTGERYICWDFYPSYFNGNRDLHDKDKWFDTDVMKSGDIKKYYLEAVKGFDELLASHGYVRMEDGTYKVQKRSDETLVFFCHLGISFLLMGHMLGIAPTCLWQGIYVAPTSVTVLGAEERAEGIASFRIQEMGDVRHLSQNGEPISDVGYFTEIFER